MVASALQVVKRALLATMRTAAVLFGLSMTCNRDSADSEVVSFFRKLALRAHPDRPGLPAPTVRHVFGGMPFGFGHDVGHSAEHLWQN